MNGREEEEATWKEGRIDWIKKWRMIEWLMNKSYVCISQGFPEKNNQKLMIDK